MPNPKARTSVRTRRSRVTAEPTRVVLASTAPAVAAVAAEPVIETIVENVAEVTEEAPVAVADDLDAKYGFDEPKQKKPKKPDPAS